MKRQPRTWLTVATVISLAAASFASDAETTARAGNNRTAGATANHNGRIGFARSDARTGSVNLARGVALGVDRHGVSLSVSQAVAPRFGPAIGGTFNLTIDRDGDVSHSRGIAIGEGAQREVVVGGQTGVHRGRHTATAHATGNTSPGGRVRSKATAHTPPNRRSDVLVYRNPHARHVTPQPLPARRVVQPAQPVRTGPPRYRTTHRRTDVIRVAQPPRSGGYEVINGHTYRVIRR